MKHLYYLNSYSKLQSTKIKTFWKGLITRDLGDVSGEYVEVKNARTSAVNPDLGGQNDPET
jgi:hypothetical protein